MESPDPSFVLNQFGADAGYELSYSDGTRFLVTHDGSRVWGTYQKPLTFEDLTTYFLGPVMGFVLRIRHIISLHASAVEIARHAVCFCGDAGAGKSTTAAALAIRGVPVIGEDIIPLQESGRDVEAVPGYPRVCLWPESVAMLLGSAEALPKLTPVWDKRFLELGRSEARFVEDKLPVGIVYLISPRTTEGSAPRIEDVTPREALLSLVQNTYMNWLIGPEQRAREFDLLHRMVGQVAIRRIIPHSQPEKIGELCDLILSDAERVLARARNSTEFVRR